MKLVFFNDPHYARHAPECRGPNYSKEILQKLHECFAIAEQIGASVIGCTGDWFHRKGRVTHAEQNDLLRVLSGWRQKGIEVVGILGNHDIAGHSLDSLHNRAAGALVNSGALTLLDLEPLYLKGKDGSVFITGTSYFHGCDANDEARVRMYGTPLNGDQPHEIPKGAVHIHLAHGTLRQSGSFFEDYSEAPELVELLEEHDRRPDVILCGHLHFDEGIKHYRTSSDNRVTVCRAGSLGRVDRTDLKRTPRATVVALKGRRWTARAVEIGKAPEAPRETKNKRGELVPEHEADIEEFVRVLREEADEFSLMDNRALVQRVNDELGFNTEIYQMALKAVEKRQ